MKNIYKPIFCLAKGYQRLSVLLLFVAFNLCMLSSKAQTPSSSSVCAGGNASFSVTASDASSYQWQVDEGSGFTNVSNTSPYSGATTSTLTITDAGASLNGNQYRVIVSGSVGSPVTSSAATLTVNSAPSITAQPVAKSACPGTNTSFTVGAAGAGLTYQWQVDQGSGFVNLPTNGTYSGATTATLSISNVGAFLDGNMYRVVVGGTCSPAVVSNSVALTVNSAPSITSQPAAHDACPGSNTSFTVGAAGEGLSYQWQVDQGSGFTNLPTNGTYSGATTATLMISNVGAFLDGNLYRVLVSGTCSPAVTSNSVALTVNSGPSITTQPAAKVACPGTNTSFTVGAAGAGLTYQWQVNEGSGFTDLPTNGTYSGATTATLTLSNVGSWLNGNLYRVIVSGTCSPAITSNPAPLSINSAPTITSQPASVTACRGSGTGFSVGASGTGLSYQWQIYNGSDFMDIPEGNPFSGVTTASLSINPASIGFTNSQFRVVVSGTCGPAATSNIAVLKVTEVTTTGSQVNVSTHGGSDGSATVVAYEGTAPYTYLWSPSGGNGATASGLKAGEYSVTVTDATGCHALRSFTIIEPLTTPVIVMPANNSYVNTNLPAVSGTADPGVTVTVRIDGSVSGTALANINGEWSYTVPSALAAGSHTVSAKASNSMLNTSAESSASTFTVDLAAPSVSISSMESNPTNANPIPLKIDFSENVSGFDQSDIAVTGASLSAFSGSGKNYTVNLIPSGEGLINVNIASSAAVDMAGNPNSAGSFSIQYMSTLPLHLSSYVVKAELSRVRLQWTIEDLDKERFEIWRSVNGKDFTKASSDAGIKLLSDKKSFVWYDESPLAGWNYYRLLSVDENGKESILGLKSLSFGVAEANLLIYPNPVNVQTRIAFSAGHFTKAELLSLSGTKLQNHTIANDASFLDVSLLDYPAGVYVIKLSGQETVVKKLVKQ